MATGVRSVPPPRTAVLTSADLSFRQRVRDALHGLKWQVREAGGGAEALAQLDLAPAETLILDSWLPDLEIKEFVTEFKKLYPEIDLISVDDMTTSSNSVRSPRRSEVLFALRREQDSDGAPWDAAPELKREERVTSRIYAEDTLPLQARIVEDGKARPASDVHQAYPPPSFAKQTVRLPEFIGNHPLMIEVSRRIRLVAPHSTSVLVQGPTGTGKELVARALHRLSPRAARPFVALNCAAIPDALLEAELFGHTRGAFTGAVQGRVGRIEAANGGTLFLDEIGEMPLSLQSKLLRFVENGELQRVGENEPIKVNVRLVAATHQPLSRLAGGGGFRSDLYYRLSVFMIRTPPLAHRMEDLPSLTSYFLERMSERGPAKSLSAEAMDCLKAHGWPGNVRELEHVLERAWILAEDRPEIGAREIEFGEDMMPS